MLLKNRVGLHCLVDILILRVHIGADDGKCEIDEKLSKRRIAAVKLVVAERHRIEFEFVQDFGNLLATIVAVEQGALKLIAGVQPQAVRVVGALLLNNGLDTRITSVASALRPGAVSPRRTKFVQMSVYVIDVEESWVM